MKEAVTALRAMLMSARQENQELRSENEELRDYIDAGHAAALQLPQGDGSAEGNARYLTERISEAQHVAQQALQLREKLKEDAKALGDTIMEHQRMAEAAHRDAEAHHKILVGVLRSEQKRKAELPKPVALLKGAAAQSGAARRQEEFLGTAAPERADSAPQRPQKPPARVEDTSVPPPL